MYADYIYYTTTYIGSALTEEEFARAATRASSFLDYYTRGKAKTYTGDELKMCCCALAEQYQIIENAQTQSMSVLKDPPACLQLKTQTYETNAPVELSERAFQVSEELNLSLIHISEPTRH